MLLGSDVLLPTVGCTAAGGGLMRPAPTWRRLLGSIRRLRDGHVEGPVPVHVAVTAA